MYIAWRAGACFCLFVLAFWGYQNGYSQAKPQRPVGPILETPKQTNDRIQQLAALDNKLAPVNTPVGPGDLLHIDVFDVPELSRDVRVDETGQITLPLVPGRIQAAGLTPFDLQERIAHLLQENGLVTNPQVSVLVKEQNSQPVSVIGAVSRPQVLQLVKPTTLIEAIADCGGLSDDAGAYVLVVRRGMYLTPSPNPDDKPPAAPAAPPSQSPGDSSSHDAAAGQALSPHVPPAGDAAGNIAKAGDEDTPPGVETIKIKVRDLIDTVDPSYNILVHGGDVISVPRSGIVYVAGAVQSPGGYVLQERGEEVTTVKAVALAHGLTSTAKANEAVIVRQNPTTGQKEEIPVHLKTIMARKAPDVRLFPNDLLFVPDSTGRKVLYRGLESALGIGTQVTVYRTAYQ
jgi:polysaccharide biosynthesis/export protein